MMRLPPGCGEFPFDSTVPCKGVKLSDRSERRCASPTESVITHLRVARILRQSCAGRAGEPLGDALLGAAVAR